MHGAYEFLEALTMVLCVAAVTTVVFHRLRQPVVLGYLLAGLIIGPHVPIPLVADGEIVHTLSELGVILLMFSLGLEFSLRKLARVGASAGLTALIQCSVMMWLGFNAGRLLGWTSRESLFAGAMIAISSTTIVARAFGERGVSGHWRQLVFGVLIVQDLIAILLMATLTTISSGAGLSAGTIALTTGRLVAFLVGLVGVGLLVVPRVMRAVVRLGRRETTLVASIGLCFGVALLAHAVGYSVAFGAFIAGSLASESGEGERVAHVVEPVRDMFAAVFFVSVGMLIDPKLIAAHWPAVLLFTLVVVLGQIGSVTLGAFLTGNGTRVSLAAGMSLAQIGEFSFIIAGLGLALGATRGFLYPIAVAVSAITTLTTPWLIRAADPVSRWVDRKLPARLQTFATLYGSWLERLRASPEGKGAGRGVRRLVWFLLLDAALLAAVIIGASFVGNPLVRLGALILAVPFCIGIVRLAGKLGARLAGLALPAPGGGLDLANAPRRAFVVALQLACVLLAGWPVVAVTQPFLGSGSGVIVLVAVVAVLGVVFWRTAANLHGHVRAGAEMIIEVLAAQAASGAGPARTGHELDRVHELLPGIGEPVPVTLEPTSQAVGRSLAELDLRGVTGATVLAITRADGGVLVPTAREVLRPGDVLALAGTHEAIEGARQLLTAPREAGAE